MADAAPFGVDDGAAFCRSLPDLAGVVAVPISAFVSDANKYDYRSLVRFAFCKRVDVLEQASVQLASLGR